MGLPAVGRMWYIPLPDPPSSASPERPTETPMKHDTLAAELYDQILQIPLIDPHTHIDPHRPAARSLDDILGYHYYTELAHSAGMDKAPLDASVSPRERVRSIIAHVDRYDTTVQYGWFLEIART